MRFEYNNKQYDLRLKNRYLPKALHNIASFDLLIMLGNDTSDKTKQELLSQYLPGATLIH